MPAALAAALPAILSSVSALGSSLAQGNATENAAQQTSDASRYGTDQGLLNSREQRTSTASEDALSRALQEKLQSSQLGATSSENALNRTQESALQANQLGSTASENALTRALQEKLANQQTGLQKEEFNTGQQNLTGAIGRGQNDQSLGQSGVLSENASSPEELQAYQSSITKNALPEQERAQNEYASSLRRAGVTGSAASILQGRQIGDQQNQLAENANQLAYQDAVARRNAKSNLYSNQASTGQSAALRS